MAAKPTPKSTAKPVPKKDEQKSVTAKLDGDMYSFVESQGGAKSDVIRQAIATLMAMKDATVKESEALVTQAKKDLHDLVVEAERLRWVKTEADRVISEVKTEARGFWSKIFSGKTK